ncbi:MAG: hypothetical protein Q7S05_04115 [bacterium]|nr:hypothetical protein [bacterium]
MDPEEQQLSDEMRERLLALPKAVQEAITSADVENRLRKLSETHKLHLDQWQKLENEVMLALLGVQSVEKLEENIRNEVGVPAEDAAALAGDIAEEIFLPIRQELEQELPPQEEVPSGESAVASDVAPPIPNTEYRIPNTSPSPIPSTPPPPPKTEKSIRAPISESYTSQTPSHERKAIDGDPYRESIA